MGQDKSQNEINREEAHARCEELGAEHVRMLLHTGGFPTPWEVHAIAWLAKQDSGKR